MRRLFTCLLLISALSAVLLAQEDKAPKEDTQEEVPKGRAWAVLDAGMHTNYIRGVYFRGEKGNQFVTIGTDHTVRIWDTRSEQTVKVIRPPGGGGMLGATMSDGGNRLAFYTQQTADGKTELHVYVLSLPEGQIDRHFPIAYDLGTHSRNAKLALSADGNRLAVSAWHEPLLVYDLKEKNPKLLKSIAKKGQEFAGEVAFSPDGTKLAWMTGETKGKGTGKGIDKGGIFDVKSGKELATLEGLRVTWSPPSQTKADKGREGLIATGGKGGVHVYDSAGKLLQSYKDKDIGVTGEGAWLASPLVFSHNWRYLLVAGRMLIDLEKKTTKDHPNEKPCFPTAFNKCSHFGPSGKQFIRAGTNEEGVSWVQTIDDSGKVRRQIVGKSMFTGDKIAWEPRWSKDGTKITWRTPKAVKGDPDERLSTFDLTALEMTPTLAADESVSTRVLERGGLKLMASNSEQTTWNLTKGGKVVAALQEVAKAKVLTHPTFVAGDRIAAFAGNGPESHICLFDKEGKLLRRLAPGYRRGLQGVLSPSPDGKLLASFRPDRGLYIWSQEQEYPLLSIYKIGNDWVAWTAGGYFAATPGGEKMVSWKIGNGIGKMPTVLSTDRFGKKFHRPDVVRKTIELGSVKAALVELHGKDAKAAQVEESLPPTVEVKVLKQDEAKVTVKVTAKAQSKSQPVVALRLMLDGMPFPELRARSFDNEAEAEWTETVEIPAGKHTLGGLARSEDASARSEPVTVTWRKAENLPVLHVVAVGINKYATGIPALSCAVNDATDIQKAFAKVKGDKNRLFKDVKTHLLTDNQANVKDVLVALKKLKPERDDIVVVFLAGHGTLSQGDFFFLTSDSPASARALSDNNALSGKKMAEALGGLGCRTLLLLDACHSGAADMKPSDEAARALADDEVAVTVLSAAMGKQKALERDGNGHFTRAIKEALLDTGKKRAPRDETGQLFIYHLYAHVSDRVAELSDFKQTPFLRLPDGVAPFPLRQFEKK